MIRKSRNTVKWLMQIAGKADFSLSYWPNGGLFRKTMRDDT
jgi:hypothetical protein